MDFVTDELVSGQRFRALTVVDIFSRSSELLEPAVSLTGKRVVEALDQVAQVRGYPEAIRVDNGGEFCSKEMDAWAYRNGVKLLFSRPGKPTDNDYIESESGKLRDECLNQHLFTTIKDAKEKLEAWRKDYNQNRPHSALGSLTPVELGGRSDTAAPKVSSGSTLGGRSEALLFSLNGSTVLSATCLHKALTRYCHQADLPIVCPHSLRGLHSSLAVQAGAGSSYVAPALGHGSDEVTKRHYISESAMDSARSARVSKALAGDLDGLIAALLALSPAQRDQVCSAIGYRR